ncbi:hypothetical protein CEXT_265581 [Caerostris extrusa]|uniref:Uncharacterized protein n=1 Tax=Caerostris extrusa TaxID=172846 RepID=A0AAV4MZN3_CAEEX|nr:hypothetical protein CEXT_265581 [Caerostris extrusa]
MFHSGSYQFQWAIENQKGEFFLCNRPSFPPPHPLPRRNHKPAKVLRFAVSTMFYEGGNRRCRFFAGGWKLVPIHCCRNSALFRGTILSEPGSARVLR